MKEELNKTIEILKNSTEILENFTSEKLSRQKSSMEWIEWT